MRKYILFAGILLVASVAFSQQKAGNVIIKGTLNGDLKGNDLMFMYTRTSNDSAVITDGHYSFTFPFTEVGMKMLYPKYIQAMGMIYQPFGILISGPGTYYVVSDIAKGMNASQLKGPEPMLLYHQFEEDSKVAGKKVNDEVVKLYGPKWWQADEKSPEYARIQASRDSLSRVYVTPVIRDLVAKHPDSYASAYVLVGSGREVGTIQDKEDWYNLLSAKMKKTDAAQKFKDYIQGLKSSSVGKEVAAFSLPDPQGNPLDFKDLSGKYVLIDFWASWCVPCRRSFPHMREVYQKYKSDSFEIYSISIDEDKAAWEKAVKEEKNPWLQALDTKNISQKGFAVTAVPASFLIDPKGKIIAKEIGFDPSGGGVIETEIKKIFDKPVKKEAKSIPMMRMN